MKRKTSYFSRVLSVFLAVVMCLSVAMMDWSTVLPEANAIGQGAWTVTSWGNVYNTDGDSNCTVTVYFTDGSTNSYSFNGSGSGTQGWSSWSKTGFPYQINVSHSYKNPDFGCTFYVQVNGSTVMEASWSNTSGKSGTNDRRGTDNWSTSTSTRPYLASCGISQGNQSITANNYGGSTQQVYWSAWANDQYGVSYPCSVTWSIPANNSGLWLSSGSGDAIYTYVPAAYGAGNQNNTIRACIGGNNRDCNLYVGNNYYYIDLNGNLDGSNTGNIAGYGYANVDIKGTRQATNCTDYYTSWPSGTTYNIYSSATDSGKVYVSGNASGTVGGSNIDVRLNYRTNSTIVINPNTGVFNGTSNNTTYTRYYGQTVSIPNPTKTGWTFTGWSKTGSTVGSISGTTFTFNTKTSGQTEYWTATWSRGMTSAFKYATEAKGSASSTINRSQSYTSPTNTYTVKSPSSSEVPVTLSKDDKTWTLKGWVTSGSDATWGAASSTATIGLNTNRSESATTETGSFTYWPVYALTTTKFYANYNYYTDEASSYTTIQKNATVSGDNTTGTMAVPTGSDNGSGAEFARYYTKGGIVYELQGWSLTNGGTTVDVPYNSGNATLNVPGAGTPTSTANLTPIELYPVYTRYAVAIKARFHYFTDGGTDNYKETNGMAIEPSLTGEITFPGADQVTTTYTKNGRTYTLVGWNLVENSESYDTFGAKAELTKLTDPANDYYTYYPVYKTVTGINFHYFTNDGDAKVDNIAAMTAENIGGTSDNINAKNATIAVANSVPTTYTVYGRTYTLKGWAAANGAAGTYTPGTSAAALAETALDADDLVLGTENVVLKVTDNGAYYEFYPVYELTSTTFTAKLKYFTGDGSTVATQDMTVNAAAYAEDGTATIPTIDTTFKKDGITYQLTGWVIDGVTYHFGDSADNVPVQTEAETGSHGTPSKVVEYTDATPIYKIVKKDLYLDFHYENAAGEDTTYTVTNADKAAADLSAGVTMTAASTVNTAYTTKINGNNVTFTLKGWSQSDSETAYNAFGTADTVALKAVDLEEHPIASANDVATAFSSIATTTIHYYPIYECTTTVRYNYYNAAGGRTSLTKSTTLTKTDTYTPTQATIKVAATSEINNNITLDTRDFYFTGWRTDNTSTFETLDKATADITLAVTDTEYQYYGIYRNDELALSYDGTKDGTGVTGAPVPETQYATQFINAGTAAKADINNASSHKFAVNPDNVTPVKTGYTYIGWQLENNCEQETATFAKTGDSHTIKVNTVMYAVWGINDVTVNFRYWNGFENGGYTNEAHQIKYDDGSRSDTGADRYVITSTVSIDKTKIDHADDNNHYYFTGWVLTQGNATLTQIINGTEYRAKITLDTTDVEVQAQYKAVAHHYKELTVDELAANGITDTVARKEATCTVDGYHWVKCTDSTCNHIYKQTLKAQGHEVAYQGYKAATCMATGKYATAYCYICGLTSLDDEFDGAKYYDLVDGEYVAVDSEDGIIAATAHDWYVDTEAGVDGVVAPTCVAQGYTVYKCRNNEAHVKYDDYVPATGHTPDTENTAVPATCTTQGKTDKVVCTVCGTVIKDEQTISALGHTAVIDEAIAPTCTETGLTEGKHCSVCDAVIVAQEEIEALGHDIQAVEAKEPTCTDIGWTAGNRCSRCDYGVDSETIPALGHDYGDNEAIIVESTCVVAGTSTQYCERCKKDIVTELELAEHTPETVPAYNGTCVTTAYESYEKCSVCGKELTKKVEVGYGVHEWIVDEAAVAATCTKEGHTESYKCKYCDEKISYNTIPATGHKYSDEVTTKYPTCTEDGYRERTCVLCGKDKEIKIIPALGHDMTKVEAKEVTCTTDGNIEYYVCSRCTGICFKNAEGTEVVKKSDTIIASEGHDWTSKVVAPTCTVKGYTLWTCSKCTVTNKTDETEATGHSGGTATCKDKAVCEVCGKSYGGYAAHNYETTTTEGTCVTKGTSTKTCTVCGKSTTKETKLGDHDYTFSVTQVPTCAETGVMTYVCIYCGDTYTVELDKTDNHTDEDSDGYCDECGKVISGSIADHSGTCDKCGKDHGDKVGGIFGYDGFICKIVALFRKLFG